MNHAETDGRLTADILTHAADYMTVLGPAEGCLYRHQNADAAIRLSGYGPIDADSDPEQEAANRRLVAGCCLLGAIELAAADYGLDDARIADELVKRALPGLLATCPLAVSAPPYSPTAVWYRVLPQTSDAIIRLPGTNASPVLARWLRQAAQHTADADTAAVAA